MDLSIIIPLYNEELLVNELIERTFSAVSSKFPSFEIICINDGSTDNTLQLLLSNKHKENISVIDLSRNYGHQTGITAGINHAKGKYIAIMDGDLQDPPELIPQMIENLINDKKDVIYGERISRKDTAIRKVGFNLFHKIMSNQYGKKIKSNSGHFCVFNNKVLKALQEFSENNRYFPGLRTFVGFDQDKFLYDRDERFSGETKMSMRSLFRLATNAIFSFSKWPLKVCLRLGFIGIGVCLIALIYIFLSKFLNLAPLGWSSTILSIYFLGSVQLIFLGVIGEYIYRIYKEVQRRPLYHIKNIY